MRFILILFMILCSVAAVVGIGLYHYWGMKGLFVFPLVMIVLFAGGKWIVKTLFKGILAKVIGAQSKVLRGATLTVHSIVPIAKPVTVTVRRSGDEDGDSDEVLESKAADGTVSVIAKEDDDDGEEDDESSEFTDYYMVEITITPKSQNGPMELWEPDELALMKEKVTNAVDFTAEQTGEVRECFVWNGSAFSAEDVEGYLGERRLKLTLAVSPGTKQGWLHYFNEPIGLLEFPAR